MAKGDASMTFGGSCRADREVRQSIVRNTDAYCRANKKGHEAKILDVKPGKRHKSTDVFKCVDGRFEAWVKFRCK